MKNNYLQCQIIIFSSVNMFLKPKDYEVTIDPTHAINIDANNIAVTLQLKKTKEIYRGVLPNDNDDDAIGSAYELHQRLMFFENVKVQLTEDKNHIVLRFSNLQSTPAIVECVLKRVCDDEKETIDEQCINEDLKEQVSVEDKQLTNANSLSKEILLIFKLVQSVMILLCFLILTIIHANLFAK